MEIESCTVGERRRGQRLHTLIPGVVTFGRMPMLGDRAAVGNAALRGFRGVVRNVSRTGFAFDAEVKAEKVIEKAKGELFATIAAGQHKGQCLPLRVRVVWAKDHEKEETARRCLVGFDIVATDGQAIQFDTVLLDIRKGRVFYKEFSIDRTVYFGDTNVGGNVYFAKFFEWQGAVREEFYLRVMPDALGFLKSGVRIVTAEARIQFKSQFVLFDIVTIEVKVKEIRTANIELLFLYKKKFTGELAAIGTQTLAFTNEKGQIIPVPSEVVGGLELYIDPYSDWKTYL